jgi:hypothetical protein
MRIFHGGHGHDLARCYPPGAVNMWTKYEDHEKIEQSATQIKAKRSNF